MKDFDRWFSEQKPSDPKPEEQEGWSELHRRVLPEGVEERLDGSLYVNCCRCRYEINVTPEDLDDPRFDPTRMYCFGSPGCVP